ncbi:MAG TPA: type II toxin-antitoxin system RatA family toxin [Burkholderiaceae bacterium]|nr:type II toxin-antitoxin system RatA family toxin [Burkholderiaceae bacterium]
MHRIERSVIVPYAATQMFDLIATVEHYPRFLPWCAAARQFETGPGTTEATIEIAYRGVRSKFSTRNRLDRPASLTLELVDGPFKHLAGTWTLAPLGDAGCRVHLLLQYQFIAGPLGRAIAPVFDALAGSLVDAFVREAEARHG